MKKETRKKMLKVRESLPTEVVEHNSKLIFDRLKKLDIYMEAKSVMLYLSFRNEVDSYKIIEELFEQGKRVFIPVTVHKTKEIIVSELIDIEKDLEVGNFGVLEPKSEALRPTDPSQLDLVIVPGVAFDEKGYRIGFGAGYYDRFLPRLPEKTRIIALAHEEQMLDRVERDEYDYPMQYILTNKRLIKCIN